MRAIIVVLVIFLAAGYFGLMSILVEKEAGKLRSEIQDLRQRLQKIEEESKAAPLQPDADYQKIIKTVNAVYHKLNALEDAFKKEMSATSEAMKNQGKASEDALKKQSETIDKLNKETQAKLQKIMFDARMANIRGHIAKARTDLLSRNIATAKNELELIDGVFEALKASVSEEDRKAIEELQATLRKAQSEIDVNLPAAINRIDLLWHEMSKLLRKT
ncbi:MAG: hypothetical protein ACOYU2_09310 [Nitrospirota bacterium]